MKIHRVVASLLVPLALLSGFGSIQTSRSSRTTAGPTALYAPDNAVDPSAATITALLTKRGATTPERLAIWPGHDATYSNPTLIASDVGSNVLSPPPALSEFERGDPTNGENVLLSLVTYASWMLLVILVIKAALLVTLSQLHHRKDTILGEARSLNGTLVSVLVPCFNEEAVLTNCLASLLGQSYRDLEIIIVDDGSTDNTSKIAESLSATYPRVYSFTKPNGGKASALNWALQHATGEIVVSADADSALDVRAIEHLVAFFTDPAVGAVGGNVKVVNRNGILGRQQALEYISGLSLQRRSFAQLGCMQVISGAIGAFRRTPLLELGGYSEDTIVEDMDVTMAFATAGYEVAFATRAIAYTEAPESLQDFLKQRYRWTFGGFQVISKYSHQIFNRQNSSMGLIGLPYFAIFPWIDVLTSLLFVVTIMRTILGGSVTDLLVFYAVMAAANVALVFRSIQIDPGESLRIPWLSLFDCLWYSHLISATTLRAGANFLLGREAKWNKLARLGRNIAPSSDERTPVLDLRSFPKDSGVGNLVVHPRLFGVGPISDDEVHSTLMMALTQGEVGLPLSPVDATISAVRDDHRLAAPPCEVIGGHVRLHIDCTPPSVQHRSDNSKRRFRPGQRPG